MIRKCTRLGILLALVAVSPSTLWACETCFGNPEDPQTKGMAAAIITLLVITYLLLITIIGLFVYYLKFKKRSETQMNLEVSI